MGEGSPIDELCSAQGGEIHQEGEMYHSVRDGYRGDEASPIREVVGGHILRLVPLVHLAPPPP